MIAKRERQRFSFSGLGRPAETKAATQGVALRGRRRMKMIDVAVDVPWPPALRENAQAIGCSQKTISSRAEPGDTECLDLQH